MWMWFSILPEPPAAVVPPPWAARPLRDEAAASGSDFTTGGSPAEHLPAGWSVRVRDGP